MLPATILGESTTPTIRDSVRSAQRLSTGQFELLAATLSDALACDAVHLRDISVWPTISARVERDLRHKKAFDLPDTTDRVAMFVNMGSLFSRSASLGVVASSSGIHIRHKPSSFRTQHLFFPWADVSALPFSVSSRSSVLVAVGQPPVSFEGASLSNPHFATYLQQLRSFARQYVPSAAAAHATSMASAASAAAATAAAAYSAGSASAGSSRSGVPSDQSELYPPQRAADRATRLPDVPRRASAVTGAPAPASTVNPFLGIPGAPAAPGLAAVSAAPATAVDGALTEPAVVQLLPRWVVVRDIPPGDRPLPSARVWGNLGPPAAAGVGAASLHCTGVGHMVTLTGEELSGVAQIGIPRDPAQWNAAVRNAAGRPEESVVRTAVGTASRWSADARSHQERG
eukprot:TRINITY_DN10854_c0_g1_i1.p1 TRINITY_DN10854_c0_g1~~TRINITY_DN10854_c0_g1_i1.p1  ORF type:complete len:401 (+),score=22.77 TRINITY_DN10854_c0_g1_i1:115-1317(+)